MYFNDKKNNTNIDHEFSDNNDNILSRIVNFISKYKKIIIISIVVIVLLIVMLLIFTNRNSNYLILNGDEVITIYQGDSYVEPGYKAYNSSDEDLSGDVKLESNLNTGVVGEYEILYKLGDITKVRYVKVIEKPQDYVFMSLTPVNNKIDIYLKKGDKYIEPGYSAFSTSGIDLTDKVTITGNVDTSKKGTYTLTYSVVDENGVKISKVRKVIVMDSEISLTLNNSNYTNQGVIINAYVIDEYFDYMILPDNNKVTVNNYSYKVSSNGTYTFKVYDRKGNSKESSIKVNNIDKEVPTGSCSGSYKDGVSSININANDNKGIANYVINGKSYTSKNITITSELKTVNVTIYDKAGNIKNISCNLEDKNVYEEDTSGDNNQSDNNAVILFDKNIKLNYQYVSSGDTMAYALYTPSIDNKGKDIPLIVWLHGSGEVGSSERTLKNSGLLGVLNSWSLEGFNAYVLCPHLDSGDWSNTNAANRVYVLIDNIISNYNIDTDKIIMSGHSLGGYGAEYMVYAKPNYFSALVVLSSFNIGLDLSKINVPTKGYVGTTARGEMKNSYGYMTSFFKSAFGSKNVTVLSTSHGGVPGLAFRGDENSDGRSDLIEWMLLQELKK